jgi:hypothetical protein
MPKSFAKAQADAINKLGGQDREQFVPFVAQSILEQYGIDFKILLEKYINSRRIVSSGKLADSITPSITEDGKNLIVKMLDYFDFPNEGVKGYGSSKNAPNSPYTYRRKAKTNSNGQFQASIKEYILSGKARVKNVKTPIKSEIKDKRISKGVKKSLIDSQVDTLIYLIKRYGIKTTDYFNDAVEEAFKDIDVVMGEALGIDIAMNIQTISSKKVK